MIGRERAAILALGWALAGCTLDAGSFAGKGCENNNDCPEPYACAEVRPGTRTCELLHGLELGPGTVAAPDYCNDVQKILNRTCVSNCHGADNSGSGLPDRFDLYSQGGSPPCAFEKAALIKDRVSSGVMPPAGASPRLTSDERTILIRWASTGAPYCRDAGSSAAGDAGTDGGNPDGGKADGG